MTQNNPKKGKGGHKGTWAAQLEPRNLCNRGSACKRRRRRGAERRRRARQSVPDADQADPEAGTGPFVPSGDGEDDVYKIYTDGSAKEGTAGWGFAAYVMEEVIDNFGVVERKINATLNN